LDRLQARTDVRTVCDALATLHTLGSNDLSLLEDWPFKVYSRDSSNRLAIRRISKRDIGRLADLSSGLGLSMQTAGTIAILCGLVDAPALPGDLPGELAPEVSAFLEAVRHRAVIAHELVARAIKHPARVQRLSWNVISGDD
jgi:hypothetical protein